MQVQRQATVVGVFHDREHARAAINELRQAGFAENRIGMIVRDDTTGRDVRGDWQAGHPDYTDSNIAAGAATGAATGAGIGALWALGIAAGVLPVIGPVIAGGILASVLASAAGAAVAGGLVGALIGLGIPEDEAAFYESELKGGRTVVFVQADERVDEAQAILVRHGAYNRNNAPAAGTPHAEHDVARHRLTGRQVSGNEIPAGETIRVPVQEDQVNVGKTCDNNPQRR
jgi:hypothetical protein